MYVAFSIAKHVVNSHIHCCIAVQVDLVNLLDLNLLNTDDVDDEDDGVEVDKSAHPRVISDIHANSDISKERT